MIGTAAYAPLPMAAVTGFIRAAARWDYAGMGISAMLLLSSFERAQEAAVTVIRAQREGPV